MRPRRLAALLPAVVAAAAATLLRVAPAPPFPAAARAEGADADGGALRRFRREFRSDRPEARAAAFRHLDPADPASLPAVYDGFRDRHFLVRGAAAGVVARVPEGPLRFQGRVDLLTHAEEAVRGGIAHAFGLAPLPGDGAALATALEDRAPEVRRDAARGLRALPSRGAVEALLRALARETDARPRVWILDTLRAMARTDAGEDPAAWEAWWRAHRDRAAFQPAEDVPPERREFAGVPLEVVTVGGAPRGGDGPATGPRRPELFALAPFGWNHAWWRPYLDALERVFVVHYLRLPSLRELTGLSGYGQGIGTYPVASLARAFEALREERGIESVAILAEGATCWVAETYAAAHPKRTRGLILVNAWPDTESYVAALRRMAGSADPEESWMARSLLGEASAERDRDEDRRMALVLLTHRLADRADLEGHRLWLRARDPQGFASVPALRFDRRRTVDAPVLFFFAPASALSGHHDARRIREAFPRAVIAAMEETRGRPFADVHDEFHRVVRGFVDRHRLDR